MLAFCWILGETLMTRHCHSRVSGQGGGNSGAQRGQGHDDERRAGRAET